MESEQTSNAELDLESRALCPDGACIGVVGPDGRCKLCGALAEAGATSVADRPRAARDRDPEREEIDEGPGEIGEEPDEIEGARAGGEPGEIDERALCVDGSCVGVIGSDGRCKVCGLPADAQPG